MAQTLVESQAVFKERAQRVGLPESARDRLIAQGVDTLAKLAFASGNPGEAPTEATSSNSLRNRASLLRQWAQ